LISHAEKSILVFEVLSFYEFGKSRAIIEKSMFFKPLRAKADIVRN